MKMWVGGRVEDKLQSCVRSVTKRVSSSVRLMSRVRHMLRRLSMVSSCSASRSDASNARACAAAREGGTEQCVGEERDTNEGWDDTAAETLVAGGRVVVDQVDERLHELQEERRGVVRVVGAPRLERLEDERDDAVPARAPRDQLLVLLVQVRRLLDQLQQRPEEMPLLSCHHLLTRVQRRYAVK